MYCDNSIYKKSYDDTQCKTSSDFRINFDAGVFNGIKVKTINGDEILLSDTWKNRPVILKVLASLGCALCKYDAKVFSELQPLFEHHNVGLVAVVFEDVDLYSFLSSGYWTWDIYLDPERDVYKTVELTKVSRLYQLKLLTYIIYKGQKPNISGGLRQLDGTFGIYPNNKEVRSFRPKKAAMHPSFKEIYSLVGDGLEDTEEQLPSKYI
ncbi:hypothetical protein K502DRAFT_356057 [Neoconidiobolus thromboides FSU 785]|nr:hypothetical protein K502DRAFT_356057 [Neoconidiobolus thromboides FSU 785]